MPDTFSEDIVESAGISECVTTTTVASIKQPPIVHMSRS